MKTRHYLSLILALFMLQVSLAQKTYEPNWESLKAYTVPEWFKDAKLGIFIHWGLYSVPAWATRGSAGMARRSLSSCRDSTISACNVETCAWPAACVGGGSNAIGFFEPFITEASPRLIGVEAGGRSSHAGDHASTLSYGAPGVLRSMVSRCRSRSAPPGSGP